MAEPGGGRRLRGRACAKINLTLKILGRRSDGFHDLRALFQTISLHDDVAIEFARGGGVSLEIVPTPPPGARGGGELFRPPEGAANLAVRAAELARAAFGLRGAIHIRLRKRIPMRAGLGGGSSDAAAVLALLARHAAATAGRRPPMDELLELAAAMGSDVPALFVGGTVLGLGRGEEVYPLPELPPWWCVVAMPFAGAGVETAAAFRAWDAQPTRAAPGTLTARAASITINTLRSLAYQALPASRLERDRSAGGAAPAASRALKVQAGLENDFEQVVFPLASDFSRLQRQLRRSGARWTGLTGSGAAQFGLFADCGSAERAARGLERCALTWVARFVRRPLWPSR